MKALTKIIAVIIAGVVLSFLLVTFFVNPMLKEVTAINVSVRAKKVELAILDQQIRAFTNAQSDLAKATRKDDILNVLVTKENLVASVLDLEEASAKAPVTEILQIKETGAKDKPSAVVAKKSGIEEVPYELSTTGDFAQTINFISYLEHLPHFTELKNFTLASQLVSGSANTSVRTGQVLGDFNAVFFIKSKDQ